VQCVDVHSLPQYIVLIVFCRTAVINAGKQFDYAIYFERPENEVNQKYRPDIIGFIFGFWGPIQYNSCECWFI
jgi:hypothetical protein